MCPFCYIGKRRFEEALSEFPHAGQVEVSWKSFQLDPDLQTEPGKNIHQHLAEKKGWTYAYAPDMNAHVTAMAREAGLQYNLDKAVVANSFNAHRVSHLAASKGLSDAMEEALFRAYFTEGKNTDDPSVLAELGIGIGLAAEEIRQVLNSDLYAGEVKQDIADAQAIGVRGVPFFVIDRKYAVSGAQQSEVFLGALTKAWNDQALTEQQSGQTCEPGGDCAI